MPHSANEPTCLGQHGIQVHAGLTLPALVDAIANAQQIVLHAAIYSNFAHNEIGEQLFCKLQDNSVHKLTIISLAPPSAWHREFAAVLRPSMPQAEVEALYERSHNWCLQLKQRFPDRVQLISTQALAFQPILLIGDRLFAGHYAHSTLTSAEGIWLEFNAVQLGFEANSLHLWLQAGTPATASAATPEKHHPWMAALGRYVEECRQAMHTFEHKDIPPAGALQ